MKPKRTYCIYDRANEEFFSHWDYNTPCFTKAFDEAKIYEGIGQCSKVRTNLLIHLNSIGSDRKLRSAVTNMFVKKI